MEDRKPRRSILPRIALAALVGLCLFPATRQELRQQIRTQFLRTPAKGNQTLEREVAERHPQDLPMQIAYAASRPLPPNEPEKSAERIRDFQSVAARFPNSPSVYANELRYLTQGAVHIHRPEQMLFTGYTPSKPSTDLPDEDAALAEYDAVAATGERLDPDNAYFPMMRSIGLLESHRDSEALEALQRASEKSRWEEYYLDEPDGYIRMQTEISGDLNAIERTSVYAAVLFPHYASLRACARTAMYFASEAEKSGGTDAQSIDGNPQTKNMLGKRLIGISPDTIEVKPVLTSRGANTVITFRLYDNGVPVEGDGQVGTTDDDKIQGLQIRQALMRCGSLMRVQSRSAIGSLVGIAITRTAMQRPGGIPAVKLPETEDKTEQERRRQARTQAYCDYLNRVDQPEEARWVRAEADSGAKAMAILNRSQDSAVWGWESFNRLGIWTSFSLLTLSDILIVLCFGAFAALAARVKPRKGIQVLRFLAVALLLGGLGLWQYHVVDMGVRPYFDGLIDASETEQLWTRMNRDFLFLLFMLPYLLCILFKLAKQRHVPIAKALGRGWRGLALPVACCLTLLFAAATIGAAHQETRFLSEQNQMKQGEGTYRAGLLGETWPGPTPH